MDPFKLNFMTASSYQWSKGFHFSPKVNEPDDGYNVVIEQGLPTA